MSETTVFSRVLEVLLQKLKFSQHVIAKSHDPFGKRISAFKKMVSSVIGLIAFHYLLA